MNISYSRLWLLPIMINCLVSANPVIVGGLKCSTDQKEEALKTSGDDARSTISPRVIHWLNIAQ